ncbi:hypothetical protein [Salinibacter phage B2_17]
MSVQDFEDNGDGTATVTLTDDMALRVRNFAASAADALNGGSSWSDLTAIQPDNLPLTLVKQDLTDTVKKKWSELDTVPSGFVVSHDNGTTRGLWRAQTATTAEPAKDSADWTLVFEVTV